MTAHNNWIPSSTWTQSIGDIPTGFFCDEPEVGHSVTQLCLIPDTLQSADTRTVYLIASCLRFYQKTVPVLVAALIGDGIAHAFTAHDAWEWSALYEAPLRWRFDYCFLLHDTSVVRPGFRKSVAAVNAHVPWVEAPRRHR